METLQPEKGHILKEIDIIDKFPFPWNKGLEDLC